MNPENGGAGTEGAEGRGSDDRGREDRGSEDRGSEDRGSEDRSADTGGRIRTLTSGALRAWPLPAARGGGKEGRGRLLVVAGSTSTPGGALLAAEAAMRAGAGKLQVATVRTVAPQLGLVIPEAGVLGLPETAGGHIDPLAAERIVDLANGCAAVLLGPGFSDPEPAAALLERVLPSLDCPVVIDALAMSYLTEHRSGVAHLGGRAVLSPNATELARTLGVAPEEVQADPAVFVRRLAREAEAAVVSGTSTTWACGPQGEMWRDDSGVPALATSGSGDVKAGIIAGLLTAGAEALQAAVWATYAHGRAGERLAAQVGSVGFLARELLPEIPRVLGELEVG